VRQLHAQGWPCRAIARELGINRATVTKLVQAADFPNGTQLVGAARVCSTHTFPTS
jgi:transposase